LEKYLNTVVEVFVTTLAKAQLISGLCHVVSFRQLPKPENIAESITQWLLPATAASDVNVVFKQFLALYII